MTCVCWGGWGCLPCTSGTVTYSRQFAIAKLSQAKPQLQLSWLALASLIFT